MDLFDYVIYVFFFFSLDWIGKRLREKSAATTCRRFAFSILIGRWFPRTRKTRRTWRLSGSTCSRNTSWNWILVAPYETSEYLDSLDRFTYYCRYFAVFIWIVLDALHRSPPPHLTPRGAKSTSPPFLQICWNYWEKIVVISVGIIRQVLRRILNERAGCDFFSFRSSSGLNVRFNLD